jgi:hypothetical protein
MELTATQTDHHAEALTATQDRRDLTKFSSFNVRSVDSPSHFDVTHVFV